MQYVCRIGTPDGRIIEEIHQATDESALRNDLERRGLHLFEARRRGLSLSLPNLRKGPRKIPAQEFLIFNQELASLLKAGLPLLQALDLMLERMRPGRFQEVLSEIREDVESGQEMSDAFAKYSESFPSLYPAALKAGERSGELEGVIRRFIRYTKLVMDARKRVISALVYPAVLVGLSLAMIVIMSIQVMPKFSEFFSNMEIELPLVTRITLGFSNFLTEHILWVVLASAAIWFVFDRWKRTGPGGLALDRFKLKIPLVGPVLHRFSISEFCRSLSTLLAGGIPLVQSFEIAVQAVENRFVRKRLEPAVDEIRQGVAFHEALEQSGVFMPLAIDMVKVGEATGALDDMLSNVSEFFDEQIENRMQRILSLIEPLMLVFLGIVIAVLLVSIYLPMFSSIGQSQY